MKIMDREPALNIRQVQVLHTLLSARWSKESSGVTRYLVLCKIADKTFLEHSPS